VSGCGSDLCEGDTLMRFGDIRLLSTEEFDGAAGAEELEEGVLEPSINAYSLPVVLVPGWEENALHCRSAPPRQSDTHRAWKRFCR